MTQRIDQSHITGSDTRVHPTTSISEKTQEYLNQSEKTDDDDDDTEWHAMTLMSRNVAAPGASGSTRLANFSACTVKKSRPLVGNFEENILNNRLDPIRTVDGYMAEVRASCNTIQPNPMRSGVRVSFYSVDESFPYLGQVNFGHRGYKIPKKGTLQVTLFNPNGTLVKLFLLHYDLNDMPPNSHTFLRQKTIFLPTEPAATDKVANKLNSTANDPNNLEHCYKSDHQTTLSDKTGNNVQSQQSTGLAAIAKSSRIKYLIQLNIVSSKSGRIYLNKDLRIFISKKVDLETASQLTKQNYELKAFDEMPKNPKYFAR